MINKACWLAAVFGMLSCARAGLVPRRVGGRIADRVDVWCADLGCALKGRADKGKSRIAYSDQAYEFILVQARDQDTLSDFFGSRRCRNGS